MLYEYMMYLLHITIVYVECYASNGEGDPIAARQEASQNKTLSNVIVLMTTMSASGGGFPPGYRVFGMQHI